MIVIIVEILLNNIRIIRNITIFFLKNDIQFMLYQVKVLKTIIY